MFNFTPKRAGDAKPVSSHAHPANRGYHVAYREAEVNHCPGCGRTHWYIGRTSAECAFCATALPLAEASTLSHPAPVLVRHRKMNTEHAWAA